jgi:hypothetical protein
MATIAIWPKVIAEGISSSPEDLRRSAEKCRGSTAADLETTGLLK